MTQTLDGTVVTATGVCTEVNTSPSPSPSPSSAPGTPAPSRQAGPSDAPGGEGGEGGEDGEGGSSRPGAGGVWTVADVGNNARTNGFGSVELAVDDSSQGGAFGQRVSFTGIITDTLCLDYAMKELINVTTNAPNHTRNCILECFDFGSGFTVLGQFENASMPAGIEYRGMYRLDPLGMNLAIQLLIGSCKTKNLTVTVTGVDRGIATYRGEPLYENRPLGRHLEVDLDGLTEVDPVAKELVDGREVCPSTAGVSLIAAATKDSAQNDAVAAIASAAVITLLIVFLLIERRRRKRYAPRPFGFDSMMDQMKDAMFAEGDSDLTTPEELKRTSVKVLEEIGQGEFGSVNKALYRPDAVGASVNRRQSSYSTEFIVAVKMLKGAPTSAEQTEYFREAAVTAQFHHDNGED